MTKDLMFGFITETWNPLGGHCYGCIYCYIHGQLGMKRRFKHIREKYSGDIRLIDKEFDRMFSSNDFVFVCNCIDIFHPEVTDEMIRTIFEHMNRNYKLKGTRFLLLTKNPVRYLYFEGKIPRGTVIGATVTSNRVFENISNAPNNILRLKALKIIANNNNMEHIPRFLSIEPIMPFDHDIFIDWIERINPVHGIAIGYDNHNNKLDEPSLKDTLSLRKNLIFSGFRIMDKTLRKAHGEMMNGYLV